MLDLPNREGTTLNSESPSLVEALTYSPLWQDVQTQKAHARATAMNTQCQGDSAVSTMAAQTMPT